MILYRAMYDIFFDKTGKSIDTGEIVTLDEIREISGDPDAGKFTFVPFFEYIDTEAPAEDGYELEDPGDDCDYEVGYDPYLGSFSEEV